MQQSEKHPRWQSFVSLNWYAGTISFLFRFVAMTSEPLLAAGIIVSAADFLQKGQLMSHNPQLSSAWSWTQALAIEASTGPVLVFALQAFRSRDQVKGVLYAVLAGLLFIVGGAMLLLQLISNLTGSSEVAINSILLYGLFALRVIVASGMVALSCTKHLRFSGLVADVLPAPVQAAPPATISPNLDEVIEKLDARYQQRMEALYERTVETFRVTIQEQVTNPQLPTITLVNAPARDELAEHAASLTNGRFASKEQEIARALQQSPHLTADELAQVCGCSVRTAEKWRSKYHETIDPAL